MEENRFSKKLEYRGKNSEYEKWANALWDSGFNTTPKEVCDMLRVSLSWFNHVLLKEINYVVYSEKFVYLKTKNKTKSKTFVRMSDIYEWIAKVGVFELQTEVVDLYSYLGKDKLAKEALKVYKNDFGKNKGFYNQGTLPRNTLKFLEDHYYSYGTAKLKNLSPIKRREVPFVTIPGFDISNKDIYFPKESGVLETVYRDAFLRGDIRIKIGVKTIFVRNNTDIDNFKIPFIIPYNSTIKLRKVDSKA